MVILEPHHVFLFISHFFTCLHLVLVPAQGRRCHQEEFIHLPQEKGTHLFKIMPFASEMQLSFKCGDPLVKGLQV